MLVPVGVVEALEMVQISIIRQGPRPVRWLRASSSSQRSSSARRLKTWVSGSYVARCSNSVTSRSLAMSTAPIDSISTVST